MVREGKDAIKERERQRREAEQNLHILNGIAHDAFETRKADLKGDGKAGRWFSPLELHVLSQALARCQWRKSTSAIYAMR